ncbi:MAG: conjugal transfer protein TraD, partial [Alphaproteobacteria bacterium]
MSIFRNDTLGSWTRGGQAIVHNVRMTTQVFFQTCVAGIVLWGVGTLWYTYECLGERGRSVALQIVEAIIKSEVPGGTAPILFRSPEGVQYWTTSTGLLESGVAKATLTQIEQHLLRGAMLVGIGTFVALLFAWWYFTRTGRSLGSNQFLRG